MKTYYFNIQDKYKFYKGKMWKDEYGYWLIKDNNDFEIEGTLIPNNYKIESYADVKTVLKEFYYMPNGRVRFYS